MKVAIYGRNFDESFTESIHEFFKRLKYYNCEISVYKPFYNFLVDEIWFDPPIEGVFTSHLDMAAETGIMFTIGGDGTFLETINLVRNSGIPIVGINSGRLGFLANISRGEITKAIDTIFEKKYTFEKRSLLKFESPLGHFADFPYGLNEFTVHKKDTSSMITVHVYVNDEYLNSYWTDGLIISTPTGSTAYSLSVGGPIVFPELNNFIIAPIAPHNLTVRPVVLSDEYEIKLKVEGRSSDFMATLDSRSEIFEMDTEIIVKRSEFSINVLKIQGYSFSNTIRNKLMWGADRRN